MQSLFCSTESKGAQIADLPGPALAVMLLLAGAGLMGYGYYLVDSSIPSILHVRAGSEEALELDIPAKGEILNVSRQGQSNIPEGAVSVDLSRPVTMKTGSRTRFRCR